MLLLLFTVRAVLGRTVPLRTYVLGNPIKCVNWNTVRWWWFWQHFSPNSEIRLFGLKYTITLQIYQMISLPLCWFKKIDTLHWFYVVEHKQIH